MKCNWVVIIEGIMLRIYISKSPLIDLMNIAIFNKINGG